MHHRRRGQFIVFLAAGMATLQLQDFVVDVLRRLNLDFVAPSLGRTYDFGLLILSCLAAVSVFRIVEAAPGRSRRISVRVGQRRQSA